MNAIIKKYTYKIIILSFISSLILSVSLFGFSLYALVSQSDELNLEQQTWLQIARVNAVAKDMIIITYNQTRDNTAYLNDLQIMLPIMTEVQNGFLNGDSTLGLPGNPSDIVQRAVQQTQTDYLSIATAGKVLLSQSNKPLNSIETNIVLNNTPDYTSKLATLALVYRQESDATNIHLLIIITTMYFSLFSLIISDYVFVKKKKETIIKVL